MKEKTNKKTIFCYLISVTLIIISIYKLYPLFKSQKTLTKLKKETTKESEFDPMSQFDTLRINYDDLKNMNPDYVCWIHIGNGVSEPVVQGTSNKSYLRRNLKKEYDISGTVFLNSYNSNEFTDMHNVIFGHNMRDGKTKFGPNEKYLNDKYLKNHPYFYIHFKNGYYTYKIIDVQKTRDGSSLYDINIDSEEELGDYIKTLNNKQKTTENIKTSNIYPDIVSLSCCIGYSGGPERLMLTGEKVRYTTYDNKTAEIQKGRMDLIESTK